MLEIEGESSAIAAVLEFIRQLSLANLPLKLRQNQKHSAASKSANVESDGSSSSHGFQGAAERAEELLYIINYSRRSNEEVDDDEANEAQPSKRRKHSAASKPANAESDGSSSSHGFLKPEGTMVGRHHDCTVIKDLDDVVSNNPNLETLVAYGNGAPTVHLPSSIWKPPQLKHLELGNSYIVDPPSAYKKNLQTLSWVVRPAHCRKEVYNKFPNIKNLKILLKDDREPSSHIGGCCSNPIILDHFDYLKWLEKLSISVSIGCNAALPELARFPSRLKKLKLSGTNISEMDLNIIAKLPELMVLKLENAFHGTVWNIGYIALGGFRQLIFLLLEAKELKKWIPEFRFTKLETIELEGCHSSLVTFAKQFQQKRISQNLKFHQTSSDRQHHPFHCLHHKLPAMTNSTLPAMSNSTPLETFASYHYCCCQDHSATLESQTPPKHIQRQNYADSDRPGRSPENS
nr:putative late blight resistance protein homolog R1A-4 isoform X1 [Ipomoea batatas]